MMDAQTKSPAATLATLASLASLAPLEWGKAALWGAAVFGGLGTLTALWDNPMFIRMTPITGVDYVILAAEALLLGLYLGIRAPACSLKGASLGGVLGFLGFGCSICNKILLLIFGSGLLLTYFEPVRYWVGLAGIAFMLWALHRKLALRQTMIRQSLLDAREAP